MSLLPALCIDLDGTLIKEDVTWAAVELLLRQAPWKVIHLLYWLLCGRGWLKAQLSAHVCIDPATLTYNQGLIAFIHKERQRGRYTALATAADQQIAHAVANHIGIFDEVIASNGVVNLRGSRKAQALCQRFGAGQFIYAGNSKDDLKVWPYAASIIVINATPSVTRRATYLNKPIILL